MDGVSLAATIEIPARAGSAAREIRDLTLAEAEQMLRSMGERPFRAPANHGLAVAARCRIVRSNDRSAGRIADWLASNWTLEAANARVIEVARPAIARASC